LDGGIQKNSNYAWSTGDTTRVINFCQEGTSQIWLNVFNEQGCDNSDTINVTIKPGYHFSLGTDTALCSGPLTLKGPNYPGASYHWSSGESTSSINVNSSGTYILNISHMNGCSATDTISDSIQVAFNSALAAPSDILDLSDCHTKKFVATNVLGATSYTWTVPNGCSIVSGQGTATVIVSYSNKTSGNLSVVAGNGNPSCQSIPTVLPVNLDDNPLNIPNAFSPNNDGINDTWVIRNIQFYPENELMVLNRWGNEVYRQQHYKNEWDGSGLNEGSYFYKLKVNFCNEEKVVTGYITIVR
jgi:gliding motility-associated-like protein